MAIRPDYTTGTVSVENGSTTVTGVGTAFLLAPVRAGDILFDLPGATQFSAVVATDPVANDTFELTLPWEGPTLAGVTYRIRFQPDGSRYTATATHLMELLSNGNVEAFAALVGALDLIPIFTGVGSMTLISKQDLVSGVHFDVQVPTIADRAPFDDQPKGYAVLVSNTGDGRAAVYSKLSNDSGDWSPPAYVTGPVGPLASIAVGDTTTLPPGSDATVVNSGTPTSPVLDFGIPSGEGFNNRGNYDNVANYLKGDVVTYLGSSYIAKGATTGNLPTDTAYWDLLAAKGQDGTGIGDVVGPSGATDLNVAVFDTATGKLIKDGGKTIAQILNRANHTGPNIPDDESVTDIKVADDAAIKSSKISYTLDETNPTDFPPRPALEKFRERISILDCGGKGTGAADDDTAAFQEAIAYAFDKRLREVFIPAHQPGAYWRISSPIVINKPIRIVGEHILNTIGQNSGFSGGQFLFNVDGVTLGEDLEHVEFENLTIRPYLGVGTRVRGVQFNRVASPVLRNVIIYAPDEGVRVTGARGYHSIFDNVQVYGATGSGLNIIDYTGGGDHRWDMQFTLCANGIAMSASSIIDAVRLVGDFEHCDQGFELQGEIRNWNMDYSRGESNGAAGTSTFRFIPASGKTQRGIRANGCMLHTDSAARAFLLGGAGVVTAFSFNDNTIKGYTASMIYNNGNVGFGQACENFLNATPAVVGPSAITPITLLQNHGNSGAISS